MITLHHLNNSRSQRLLWLLEELGLKYKIKFYQRDARTMLAPDALREIHPLGKSPVITDGKITLAESGAIIEYLVEKYGNGQLTPDQDSEDYLRYRYWMHYAEGSAMPPLLLKLVFDSLTGPNMPLIMKPAAALIAYGVKSKYIDPQLALHLEYMENELQERKWFAGENFSAADIQMSFPLEAAQARGALDDKHPALQNFLERIHARPAYKSALERGGEYELLG
jgi:glutathione S-transferase